MSRWGKNKLHIRKGRLILISLIIFIVFVYLVFLYIESQIEPILIDMSVARTKQIATNSINDAISNEIAQNTNFEDLIQFESDNDGKVSAVTFNYSEFAEIVGKATSCIEETINDLEKYKETIKLGAILNSSILSNVGPNIPITIIPMGSVQVNPRAEYQNAGINVVIMTVMIDIRTELQVIIPFASEPTIIETSIPIVQAQIFGEVPQFYFEGQGFSSNSDTNFSYIPPLQIINSGSLTEETENESVKKDNSIPTAMEKVDKIPGFEEFYPVISN